MKRENPTVGDWKYDEQGRKYRMVGTCKEYAPRIQTSFGEFYCDELEEQNRRNKEAVAARIKAETERLKLEPKTYCPIKSGRNNGLYNCSSDCAFYEDGSCIFTVSDIKPTKDTQDSYCQIIGRKCNNTCTWYKNGCALACIIKGVMSGKENDYGY